MTETTRPRTLTGAAIGDSLGMAFEMKDRGDPALRAWDGAFQHCPDSHPFCKGLRPGQWTDDTKMAVALAGSLLEAGMYSPALAAQKYLAWYRSKDWRGIGTATKNSMIALDSGVPWIRSGVPGAEGNGTAMRIAPLGLHLHRENDSVIADFSRMDASITHDSDEAREGSAAIAVLVALLVRGLSKEDAVLRIVMGTVIRGSAVKNRIAHAMGTAAAMVGSDPQKKVECLADSLGTEGHVVKTVPAAVFCLLATKSFTEAVELAVRAGGDTDTTAAVTGALAGTIYGPQGTLPYCDKLEMAQGLSTMDADLFASRGI